MERGYWFRLPTEAPLRYRVTICRRSRSTFEARRVRVIGIARRETRRERDGTIRIKNSEIAANAQEPCDTSLEPPTVYKLICVASNQKPPTQQYECKGVPRTTTSELLVPSTSSVRKNPKSRQYQEQHTPRNEITFNATCSSNAPKICC